MKFCESGKMLYEYPNGGFYCSCGKKYDAEGNIVVSSTNGLSGDKEKKVKKRYPNMNDVRVSQGVDDKTDVDYDIEILNKKPKTPNEVRCPNCGSNQITMVNRKWSLLTGFFTNKVDRICLNCKTKF